MTCPVCSGPRLDVCIAMGHTQPVPPYRACGAQLRYAPDATGEPWEKWIAHRRVIVAAPSLGPQKPEPTRKPQPQRHASLF